MPNIALFDLDGTLCDYEGTLRRDLLLALDPDSAAHHFLAKGESLWDIEEDYPHAKRCMRLIKSVPGWWEKLPLIEHTATLLRLMLSAGYEVQVLTKGPAHNYLAWQEKVAWCRKHLPPEVKVTITEDKSLVYGKVLVDDWPEYIEAWLKHRPRGKVIMPAYPYNTHLANHPQIYRLTADEESSSVAWRFLTAPRS